jgi:hypothetical protein
MNKFVPDTNCADTICADTICSRYNLCRYNLYNTVTMQSPQYLLGDMDVLFEEASSRCFTLQGTKREDILFVKRIVKIQNGMS